MADYSPPTRFDCPAELFVPTYTNVNGVQKRSYPASGTLIKISFRSFGGTETTINGVYGIEATATVDTWYNPDIKSDCRIKVGGLTYEILGDPENINMRGQFMRFKVRRIGGVS